MKKSLLLGLLVTVAAGVSALANTITTAPDYGPYNVNHGGEFTVTPDFAITGYVSGKTSDIVQKGTFQTFCLEINEVINPNSTYDVEFNQKTLNSNKILNKGVAWLYAEFAAGTLDAFNYSPTADRRSSAASLQKEIWYLLGEIGTSSSVFHPIVEAAALAGGWNMFDASNGWLGVSVLNLWNQANHDARQDVLVITTPGVPDGGLTLALLGMGLTGLGMASRRIRK